MQATSVFCLIEALSICVSVYDVSNKQSFSKLDAWLNELETFATKHDMVKMLVGNKIDKVCTNLLFSYVNNLNVAVIKKKTKP